MPTNGGVIVIKYWHLFIYLFIFATVYLDFDDHINMSAMLPPHACIHTFTNLSLLFVDLVILKKFEFQCKISEYYGGLMSCDTIFWTIE